MDEAAGCFQQALRLRPDYADAHKSLEIARAEKGKVDEAIARYREA